MFKKDDGDFQDGNFLAENYEQQRIRNENRGMEALSGVSKEGDQTIWIIYGEVAMK